jgi:probable addiction module antidote protein
MALKTTKFDPADYLNNEQARAAYLIEALQTDDTAFIADALSVIARVKDITLSPRAPNPPTKAPTTL